MGHLGSRVVLGATSRYLPRYLLMLLMLLQHLITISMSLNT